MEIKETTFKIIVKPNSRANEVLGYDPGRGAYIVNIKAKAEHNKANIEVIKLFSRMFKKRARIVMGLNRREKVVRVE